MVEIRSREQLSVWLFDKPSGWGHIILARAAMRAIPYGINAPKTADFGNLYELSLFRAISVAWSAVNFPQLRNRIYLMASLLDASEELFTQALRRANDRETDAYCVASIAALATFAAAEPRTEEVARAVESDPEATAGPKYDLAISAKDWEAISRDCDWLVKQDNSEKAARILTRRSLWLGRPPETWKAAWYHASLTLFERDQSFVVWIDWFERRIRGERAAFLIPGDHGRIEDKSILTMLADGNDEEFWSQGTSYVNSSLELWIDEARARVAAPLEEHLPEAPTQDSLAIAYSVNSEGKVDRLPASNQQHLRDQPDQRQIYADAREAFDELRAEGQRLGETLTSALDRMIRSMPHSFEDAQAYLVWRDGNRLRRILFAHEAVVRDAAPDPAKLDLAVAAHLDEALQLYNLFAFGDEGLRAKDESAIPPQERISGAREAELAKPVVAAMLANPDIATPDVRDDVQASLDDNDVPPDNPYAPHTIDQNIRTWRNLIAAVVAYGRAHPAAAFVGLNLAAGITSAAGEAIFTDVMGTTQVYAPLINFIVANAPSIKAYAVTAYSNGSVGVIIDAIVRQVRGVE